MTAHNYTPTHNDVGLQPERTDLAWGRTTLSLMVATAVFLRWIPHHGWFVGALVLLTILSVIAISCTRKRRLHRAINGINQQSTEPAIATTIALAGSVVSLAVIGIITVICLPPFQ